MLAPINFSDEMVKTAISAGRMYRSLAPAEMRASMLRAGDETRSVRLSVLTLVVACADRESADRASEVVERMAANHPTRAIVMVADAAGAPRTEADLSISCSATPGEQICVELVRKLELSGCGVIEIGVHHYPRLHGRSQFFRVKSLLKTLFELLRLWVRVVVLR